MIRMIGQRLAELAGMNLEESRFPINIQKMGNNSVATIPTLLHELEAGKLNEQGIKAGDIMVMASVGAGMHANCFVYQA